MEGGIKLTKHPCFVFAVGQTQIGFPGKMVVDTGFLIPISFPGRHS